ncbi:MAG: flavodoxin [Chloroflexi bacterium]|nr:flavodoxin [Chloroflexota bacterium]
MNVKIIVHSKTGNTLSVAEKLRGRLETAGHTVRLEQVRAANESEIKPESIKLSNSPKTTGFDLLVFGAPVNGGKLSAVMQAYLQQLPSLEGAVIAGFVTEFFPSAGMGGNQAIANMEELLRAKGGKLSVSGVVNWIFKGKRNKLIAETIEKIAQIG